MRLLLHSILLGCLLLCLPALQAQSKSENYRFLYNSDGENMFNIHRPPMNPNNISFELDEIAKGKITTIMVCPNLGMVTTFPSKVTRNFSDGIDPPQVSRLMREGRGRFGVIHRSLANLISLMEAEHDPCGLIIDGAKRRGLETFISYRLNEVQDVDTPDGYPEAMIISKFWKDNPNYWIGKPGDPIPQLHQDIIGQEPRRFPIHTWLPGALNFALPEVRDHRLTQIQEILDLYDIDGLEIDFQRYPMFFKPEEAASHLDTMTSFLQEVKKKTEAASEKYKHPVLLTARVMARPDQNEQLGLDVKRWAQDGLIDFLVVSHHQRNDFPLPIKEYREILPENFPLYGAVQFEESPERYREIVGDLKEKQTDGIYLFNYFQCRLHGRRPDFDFAKEIGTQFQPKSE
ncbi:MAG: hypothetical protein KDA65_16510 [Planctomycetaceae bacterium]|nr:hypothetical protein [Planctomycetaceae bacterium]